MRDSDCLERIGYSNLEQIEETTCSVYLGEKDNKKYILKFVSLCNQYPNNQIKNEIKAKDKLKGLNGVLCDWQEFNVDFSKSPLIIRQYIEGKEMVLGKKYDRDIFTSIKETICQIHDRGVCNIDFLESRGRLKNIILDENSNPLIIDFGLVKFREDISKIFFYERVENDISRLRELLGDRRYRDFPETKYLV